MKRLLFAFALLLPSTLSLFAHAAKPLSFSPNSVKLQNRLDGSCQPIDTKSIIIENSSSNTIKLSKFVFSSELENLVSSNANILEGTELKSKEQVTLTFTYAPTLKMGKTKIDASGALSITVDEYDAKGDVSSTQTVPIQIFSNTAGTLDMELVHHGKTSLLQDGQTIDIGRYNLGKGPSSRFVIHLLNQGTDDLIFQNVEVTSKNGMIEPDLRFALSVPFTGPGGPFPANADSDVPLLFSPKTADPQGLYEGRFVIEAKDAFCKKTIKHTLFLQAVKTNDPLSWNILSQEGTKISSTGIVYDPNQMPEDIRGKAAAWIQVKVPRGGQLSTTFQLETLVTISQLQATWDDTLAKAPIIQRDHDDVPFEMNGFLTKPTKLDFIPPTQKTEDSFFRTIMQVSYTIEENGIQKTKTVHLYMDSLVVDALPPPIDQPTEHDLSIDQTPGLKGGPNGCSTTSNPQSAGVFGVLFIIIATSLGMMTTRKLQKS